jgi:uncharacterized protein (DUF1501 family)
MKKILFAVIGFVMVGCSNPSMERGLEELERNLAELEAQVVAADIDGMLADLEAMNAMATQALADMEETNANLEAALVTVEGIIASLAEVQTALDNAVTKEQVAALAAQVNEVSEGIAMLVFIADYDYDGVMNGLDQCPDTPITEINDVNGVGCSPSQLAG